MVDRWELLSNDAAAAKLGILAQSLAQTAPQLDPANRRFAAELAMRLIEWPGATAGEPHDRLLLDCESVLSAVRSEKIASQSNPAAIVRPDVERPDADRTKLDLSLPVLARLPGGGLPLELEAETQKIVAAKPRQPVVAERTQGTGPIARASREPAHSRVYGARFAAKCASG